MLLFSGLGWTQTSSNAADPDVADPAGLEFDIAMSYSPDGDILLFYVLSNVGNTPFSVEPSELKIYYGTQETPYGFTHSPAPGLANQLSHGESEFGNITIENPPFDSDNLQLVWPLLELTSANKHTLLRSFGDIIVNLPERGP